MMKRVFRNLKWLVLGAALLGKSTSVATAGTIIPESFWSDPAFVAGFAGSYGVNSATEPPLTPDEQQFLIELAGIIPTNQVLAVERLTEAIGSGKTRVRPAAPPEGASGRPKRKSDPEPREITITNPSRLHYVAGNLQVQEGELEKAARSYRSAIEAFPAYMNAHKNLGIVLVRSGKPGEARPFLLRAIELGAADGNLYGLLGTCYMSDQNFRSAELAFNQASVLAPDRKEWRLGTARALFAQSRYADAAGLFGELIRKDPSTADYWLFQANCFIALNEPLKAALNYEILREMGSATPGTLTALGDIYLSRSLAELALDAYVAALEMDPAGHLGRALRSAEVLAARRAIEQSGRLLARIRELAGTKLDAAQSIRLLRIESKLALARGEDERAAGVMESLLAEDPVDGEITLLLGRYYGRVNRVAEAEMLFDRATRISGFEAEAHLRWAQMLASPSQQRFDRAIEHLKRAQEYEKKDNVQRYLEALERRANASRG